MIGPVGSRRQGVACASECACGAVGPCAHTGQAIGQRSGADLRLGKSSGQRKCLHLGVRHTARHRTHATGQIADIECGRIQRGHQGAGTCEGMHQMGRRVAGQFCGRVGDVPRHPGRGVGGAGEFGRNGQQGGVSPAPGIGVEVQRGGQIPQRVFAGGQRQADRRQRIGHQALAIGNFFTLGVVAVVKRFAARAELVQPAEGVSQLTCSVTASKRNLKQALAQD